MRVPIAVIAYGLFVLMTNASAQNLDPINNMCVRFDHQSVLKNGTLYIDGGRQTFIDVSGAGNEPQQIGVPTYGYNEYLIAIDMNQSWDWKTNISEQALSKTANTQTGVSPPVLSRGALYHGMNQDNNIYLWGGTTSYFNVTFPGYKPPRTQEYSLWSYNIVTHDWNQYNVTSGAARRPNSGSFTDAIDQGLSFYFNGMLDSGSEVDTEVFGDPVKQYLEGMIVLDTVNQTAKNLSTKAVVGDSPRARGRMQYIGGIGGKGILVQIGGNQQPVDNTTDPYVGSLLPMDEIDIFDISSSYDATTPDGTWYKQITSGDIPSGRVDFCLVLASADSSAHNIYMYGGRGANDAFFDEVWILSIPSFTWTKVYQGTTPRYGHTCHRAGNKTMISVGGAANTFYNSKPCDWETRGVNVFDMSNLIWGSIYDASAGAYQVPTRVFATIGGTADGDATMHEPSAGFDSPGLSALFDVPYLRPPAASYTPKPVASDSTSSPSSSGSHPNPNTGVIIGGLLGGLAFVGCMGSFMYRYRRRIRQFVIGGRWHFEEIEEIDGQQKAVEEMMAQEVCWELPAVEKPIEMWSPTDRYSKSSMNKELPPLP